MFDSKNWDSDAKIENNNSGSVKKEQKSLQNDIEFRFSQETRETIELLTRRIDEQINQKSIIPYKFKMKMSKSINK